MQPPHPPTPPFLAASSTCFSSSFWKGSVVWSQWTQAHFVCSERSRALNWLSHFYIIRYWQVGGARREKRGSSFSAVCPQGERGAKHGLMVRSWLKCCCSVHTCLVKTGRIETAGIKSFNWMSSYQGLFPEWCAWKPESSNTWTLASFNLKLKSKWNMPPFLLICLWAK